MRHAPILGSSRKSPRKLKRYLWRKRPQVNHEDRAGRERETQPAYSLKERAGYNKHVARLVAGWPSRGGRFLWLVRTIAHRRMGYFIGWTSPSKDLRVDYCR